MSFNPDKQDVLDSFAQAGCQPISFMVHSAIQRVNATYTVTNTKSQFEFQSNRFDCY
ncbi:hypothetical protein [Pleionea mediterranea]|uniref:hypothetical protein n=1 Tax=Pleionea mediterranea TaxID=523701 RepID=UPI001474B1B0|nr:hypothetical protein [Pleionea mediterranea]